MRKPCELALRAAMETLTDTFVVAGHYYERHEGTPNGCERKGCREEDVPFWRACAAREVQETLAEMFGKTEEKTVDLAVLDLIDTPGGDA